ncbi:MAG TPA: cation:proton antiporter [Candidatus Paceibacterota bacterium]|nr:cation:proton antiporter [Candidatus Paceibacterota bacterium]
MEIFNSLLSNIPNNFLVLFQIGIMIILAGIFAFVFKILKQPKIPAYIIAGILLGPLVFGIIKDNEVIRSLSEIGVAFLLFFVGLEIDLSNLKRVGKVASFTGIIEVILVSIVSVVISLLMGFENIELVYISGVIAFSSTMIVIKLLADKEEINTLHGRIIVGILLIQDIIAIIILTVLTTNLSLSTLFFSLGKGILFIILGILIGRMSHPILKESAKSNELLLLVPLAFLFIYSISAYLFGLSVVVGAFFAGVVLANSPFKIDIKGRIYPLRDFFGAILFVSLGIQLLWIPKEYLGLFIILMAITLIIKPIIIFLTVRLLGYTNRTAFLTGNSLGQASEFALIILTQGLAMNHISSNIFSVLVFVTIISMSVTSYTIKHEQKIYKIFSYPAKLFEHLPNKKEQLNYQSESKGGVIILGCHRMGTLLLQKFSSMKEDVLVIDFNPDIIKSLMKKKVPCLYGDYANPEIMSKIIKINPKMLISTIPDKEDNINLIRKLKKLNKNISIIVVAERIHEALELYKEGADYVILPKVISGVYIDDLIEKITKDKKNLKKNQIDFLNKIHYYLYK